MTVDPDRFPRLLRRAREMDGAREFASLHALLRDEREADLLAEPELAFLFADVARRVGAGETSARMVGLLGPICRRRGNDRLNRKRSNLEGILHFDRGRYDEAEEAWLHLLADANTADDEEFAARATNNLGILCTLSGRLEEALAHYGRAITSYQRLGYRRGLAQSHQNLAITYRELGYFTEAERHFHEAVGWARLDGSTDELARAEQERALLHLLAGDPKLALATALRAHDRYRQLKDPAGQAEVKRILGLIAMRHDDSGQARLHLDEARAWAQEHDAALLEAECMEALAALAEREGDGDSATRLREEAGAHFSALGAGPWGERVRSRVREIAQR